MNSIVSSSSDAADATSSIYRKIITSIDNLVSEVKGGASEEMESKANQELFKAKQSAHGLLSKIRDETNGNLQALERNADWNTFTMAFYGETNAGKSTVIETLRIMFNEPEKMATQKEFKEIQAQLDIDEASFNSIRSTILKCESNKIALVKQLQIVTQVHSEQVSGLQAQVVELALQLDDRWKSLTLFQKICTYFSGLPEKTTLIEKKKQVKQQQRLMNEKLASVKNEIAENNKHHDKARAQHVDMERKLGQLEPLADGGIIGDGRSDYTLDSQRYLMDANNHKFALLDVPGIEGKEEKVSESIWQAVQKAHVVFYVTAKATAPQTGDDKNKGTLEKIKEHLGDQTEVWSIYNKRINNPMHLKKPNLLNQGEVESLKTLDMKMHEQLGENYQGSLSVCGLVGFLAAADCLVPGQMNSSRKDKFLAGYDEDHLLNYSGMRDLKRLLSVDFVKDYKVKIKRSNVNKANQSLKAATGSITSLKKEKFQPLYETLKLEAGAANDQLVTTLESLKSRLYSISGRSVDRFKSDVRSRVYAEIESDIDNDDFKYELKRAIECAQEEFDEQLPLQIMKEVSKFESEVKDIVERFQKHADELLELYSPFDSQGLSEDFDLSINIDNGVSYAGIIGSVIGGIILALSGAGLAAIAIGAVGLVFSFYKSVRSFFSSKYKMAQQKKSADDNLYDVGRELESTVDRSIDEAFPKIEGNLKELGDALYKPVENTKVINDVLTESISNLQKISHEIEGVI